MTVFGKSVKNILKNRKLQQTNKQNIDNLQSKTVAPATVDNFVFSLLRGIPLW